MTSPGLFAMLLALGTAPLIAQAQQVYRSVGPDGRVVFTDVPPPQAATSPAVKPSPGGSTGGSGSTANLPFALRQVAERFPVTLYTRPECAPCDAGRSLLVSRGVPYAERTVTTSDDVQAMQRLVTEPALPLLAVGGQHLKGYASGEWNQYLDAAGYPKSSMLPAGWKPTPGRPLAPQAVAASPAPSAPAVSSSEQAPVAPSAAPIAPPTPAAARNPAGIQF
jgi:glutaredoxin